MALMLWVCPVWADEIEGAPLQIQNNIRLMIDAGISEDDATLLTRSMLQHRFTKRHVLQVQNMLMEIIQAGLPVDPVMNKAFEGMAKNKPDETIVQAMKKIQSRFAYAYRKAQELTTDEENQNRLGLSIAQGMGAGLQDEDIEHIMARLQTRTRLMSQNKADELCLQTFLTARTMARLGVDPDNVSDVVCVALQNRFTAREIQQLRSNFNSRSQQMSANQLANQFAQEIGNTGQSGADQGNGNNGGSGNTSGDSGVSESGSGNSGSGGSDGMGGSRDGGSNGGGANGSGGGNGKK